jgi:hypothetical protein
MDAELAQSLWCYDAETGVLRWKIKPCDKVCVGDVVDCPNSSGHLRVQYRGKKYLVHRLVWLISTGNWPKDQLDHLDGNPGNNRLSNLREATGRQNQRNAKCHRAGQLRFTTYHKASGRWMACSPRINGKIRHLGCFDTMEEASEAAERWLLANHPDLV